MIVLLAGCVAAAAQLVVFRLGGQRVPIGDEVEYLTRARAEDPFGPDPFLRVPAMMVLMRAVGGHRSEHRARVAFGVVAALTVTVTSWAAYTLFGAAASLVCCTLLSLWPDRVILSQHLWPDIVLALWYAVALAMLAQVSTGASINLWLFGAVSAAACLTRVDGLALPVALTLVQELGSSNSLASHVMPLWAPPVLALGLLTVRNARRYGIHSPDTTVMFNIAVVAHDRTPRQGTVESLVRGEYREWIGQRQPERRRAFVTNLVTIGRNPMRHLGAFAQRAHQMLGPDTFAQQRLMAVHGGAYPCLDERVRRTLICVLNVSFGTLVVIAVAGAADLNRIPSHVVLLGCGFLVTCATHARTRYRYALLPALSLAATHGTRTLTDHGTRFQALMLTGAAGVVVFSSRGRRETAD